MAVTGEIKRPLQVAGGKGKPSIQSPSLVDGLGLKLSKLSVSIVLFKDPLPRLQAAVELRS